MADPGPFKETLFSPQAVATLADALLHELPEFDTQSFTRSVFDAEWQNRELKARLRHVTAVLRDHVPHNFPEALTVLLSASGKLTHGGFVALVPADYIATYGLDFPDQSLPALGQLTKVMSSEFAIRPFIVRYQEQTMAHMLAWSGDDHEQVRRLSSEGCRPRLPWGIGLPAFKADPAPIVPILDRLRDDPSEMVRRSVANNLNDISKDNPATALQVLRRWRGEADSERVRGITKHALRSLVKSGDPEALQLLGFPRDPKLVVRDVAIDPKTVEMGSTAKLSFVIESTADTPQNLVVDYVVHYVKANGALSPKVWKLKQLTIAAGETVRLTKTVSFKPVSTRRHYPGVHAIEPKVNGHTHERVEFEVEGDELR